MNNQDFLEVFITKLLEEKGVLVRIDEKVKMELVASMKQQLEEIINRNILAVLDDESIKQFSELLDNEISAEELEHFFSAKNIDTTRITAKSLQQFREAYMHPN